VPLPRRTSSFIEDGFDERELVSRAATDPGAFATLYRRYVHRVHGYIYRRTGSRDVAEDVTSATFERALRSIEGFEWRAGGFGPWIFRIAANELADHHRRQARAGSPRAHRAVHALHSVTQEEIDERSEVGADLDALRTALDRLNPRYQRALELRYLASLSHEDAARAFGASKATFAVVVHRATAALRKVIDAHARAARIAEGRAR
jgi:RNA polymerase sigma-70 factor (ECF subfamily)